MKTDRTALLWGTVIGVSLVAATLVLALEFPHFRMPFSGRQAKNFLVSAAFFGMLIAAYRRLWKIPGFWALLFAFLGAHVTFYWLFVAKVTEEVSGLRMDVLYGVISGVEFVIFALIVARLYHRGPDTRFLTGPKAH
jgi:hypothetical protein